MSKFDRQKNKIMKKNLLLVASLFIGATAIAQFTQSNSPAIGDGATLYEIDSMAPSYANEIGSNANWDYSNVAGYNNVSRTITGVDATATTNASSFPNAVVSVDMQGFLQTYASGSSSERTGHGFVYTDSGFGDVIVTFDVDPAVLYNYPMDENSPAIMDDYEGELESPLGVSVLTGNLLAQVDGKGTLKLAENEYQNVLRYKIIDTINTNVTLFGDVQMVRVQYEYYDHAQSNLPIFIYTSIDFKTLTGTVLSASKLVLSLEDPSTFVGLTENELAKTSVYPVPATDVLNIQLPSSVEKANVTISDVQGRQVYSTALNASVKSIDVSNMKKGMYILNISSEATSVTKNIVIK